MSTSTVEIYCVQCGTLRINSRSAESMAFTDTPR